MNLEKTVQHYRQIFKDRNPGIKTAHTEKGHFYVSPKSLTPYHSVTYFTSFIKDPSLANYKMNRGLEAISNFIETTYQPVIESYVINRDLLPKLVEQSKLAPEGEFLNAGDIGTQTHNWRQQYFQAWIDSGEGQLSNKEIDSWLVPSNEPEVISGCRAIKKFLKETGAIPIACEFAMVDDDLEVGGMGDDMFIFPNPRHTTVTVGEGQAWADGAYKTIYKPYLGFVDLKTSNQGKKPSYAYQVRGFYQRMIRKTFGIKPKKTYILHTSKEDGTYKLIDLTDMDFLEEDAKYLVHCSRSWDKVLEGFKPKIRII